MDTSLPTYEAAMRDASGFLRRRDLASQDEVPLYFAWERLYAAANANLSTDFLQETPVERDARLQARLAPRRGLPPPLFTSFDKVRRNSAHASTFLRSTTPSANAIEMMARRYRREAEKLRGARAVNLDSPPASPVDTVRKRKKKLKKSRSAREFQAGHLDEASQGEQDAPISPLKPYSITSKGSEDVAFTAKYTGSMDNNTSFSDKSLADGKCHGLEGKAAMVRPSNITKMGSSASVRTSVVTPVSIFPTTLSSDSTPANVVEMMESSTASPPKGHSGGRGKNAWGTVKAAAVLRAKYKVNEETNTTVNTTVESSLQGEGNDDIEAEEGKIASAVRSPRSTTASTPRSSSQSETTNDAKVDEYDDEILERRDQEMEPSHGEMAGRRSYGTERQTNQSTRRSSLGSQHGVEAKADARRKPSVVTFADELGAEYNSEEEGEELRSREEDDNTNHRTVGRERVDNCGNEQVDEERPPPRRRLGSSSSVTNTAEGDIEGAQRSLSDMSISSHASGGLKMTRKGKTIVVTFEGEVDDDPPVNDDTEECLERQSDSGRHQPHTIDTGKKQRRPHSSVHNASETGTSKRTGDPKRRQEAHYWSQVKGNLREMTRQMQSGTPPERNDDSSHSDEKNESNDPREQYAYAPEQRKNRAPAANEGLDEKEPARTGETRERRPSRVKHDSQASMEQVPRTTTPRDRFEDSSGFQTVAPVREHRRSTRKEMEEKSAYDSWERVNGDRRGSHASDHIPERCENGRRREVPVTEEGLPADSSGSRRHHSRTERGERQYRRVPRHQPGGDSDSLDSPDNQRYPVDKPRRSTRRKSRVVDECDESTSEQDDREVCHVRGVRDLSIQQEARRCISNDTRAVTTRRNARTSAVSDGKPQYRGKYESQPRSRHEPNAMTSSGSSDESADGWDPDEGGTALEEKHRVPNRHASVHHRRNGTVPRETERRAVRDSYQVYSTHHQRKASVEREENDDSDSDFYDDPCVLESDRQRGPAAGRRTRDIVKPSRSRISRSHSSRTSSHHIGSDRQRTSIPGELEESDTNADDLGSRDEVQHDEGRHRSRASTCRASRPRTVDSRPSGWLSMPPAPFDSKSSHTADRKASQANQKRESAGTRRVELPEGIVWPPGMEDECVARLGLDGHHPMAPPGLEHLVTQQQWDEYWTWLHWYSSWQMWYAKNGKQPRRKASSQTRPRHEDRHVADSRAKQRVNNANWWVDASPSNQHA